MKNSYAPVLAFAIFFLFFIQMTGILIESIYILDLMNTSLDAKVLGLLFFFTPALLLPFRKRIPIRALWLIFSLLLVARGLTPYLSTFGRLLASGIGTGSALLLFPFLVTAKVKGESTSGAGWIASAGLALGVGLSVLLRTLNYSLDYSLTPAGGWVGWVLGLALGWTLNQLRWEDVPAAQPSGKRVTSAVFGICLVLTLVYFAFSAPAVIARWTEGNYALIVIAVSLLSTGWTFLAMSKPGLFDRLSRVGLLVWNLLFTLSLAGTLLAQRVSFPLAPDSPPVVVGAPAWLGQVSLALMLLFFPVIFLDLRLFFKRIQQANPSPRDLLPGLLMGMLALVLFVFMHIFTNVWGYVEPVSTPFRGKFWLVYFLIAGALTLLAWLRGRADASAEPPAGEVNPLGWAVLLAAIFIAAGLGALHTERVVPGDLGKTSLLVMTYNIQQANDDSAERSYDRQLALIQQVSPDILALQESDSARISLNNNDYVRYYAGKLGYYVYYGPTTVTGTFGTAILSKYRLQNTRTIFTFSDVDETAAASAQIEVGGRRFTIYNVHPDGSDAAMLTFARNLLKQSEAQTDVIILGDFNLRDTEEAYKLVAAVYTNAWTSVYPSKISPDGTDMSGRNRIDHIFFSPSLRVRNPFYILPPASATDHPVHWAEIFWGE
jgi:endonuclease/exonuclease/phosphatase family metal-dependent hydrolase